MEQAATAKMEVVSPDHNLAAAPPGIPEVKEESGMDVDLGGTADQKPAAPPPAGMAGGEVKQEAQVEVGEASAADQEGPAQAGPQVKEEEGECLVGCYVGRSTAGRGRILLGKVASYDAGTGMYSVVFEDGRGEELGLLQLREILQLADAGASGMKLSCRKRKLDLLVSSGVAPDAKVQRTEASEASVGADASGRSMSGSDLSDDAESSSNSSDSTKDSPSEPCPQAQGPELPPSSGDIAVPEEAISYLFSVYNFLRSFSVRLFLSPFGLDDFVGALNCTVQNSLMDAVHVSLMRALRRHLEASSSEGSDLASKCLRYHDWALLDTLTWPAFLLEYLYVMGCSKDLGGQSLARSLSDGEYYSLPVIMKLRILQVLCDHVIDSDEFKIELEAREGYNEEMEHNVDHTFPSESATRAFCTRSSKTSAWKKIEDLKKSENPPSSEVTTQGADALDVSQDGNSDDCRICGMDGTLVCCDGCPAAYHSRCIGLNKAFLPGGLWFCPECAVNKLGPTSSRIQRGARGAEIFGVDLCGRLFLGSCNYLLVIGTSMSSELYSRYYNQDAVVNVLQILSCSDAYADICRRILEYWGNLLPRFHTEKSEQLDKGVSASHTQHSDSAASGNHALKKAGDASARITTENGGDSKVVILSQNNDHHDFVARQVTANSVEQAECLEEQKCNMTSNGAVTDKTSEISVQTSSTKSFVQNVSDNAAYGVTAISSLVHQNLKEKLANGSSVTDTSCIRQGQPTHMLAAPDLVTCSSGIDNGMSRGDMASTINSAKADSSGLSYESKHPLQLIAEKFGMSGGRPTKVLSFKPQAYINLYNHGDVAASAAANLAVLTSSEGKVSESRVTSNPRKKMAADIALQIKAFSSAAAQFVWPSSEKRLTEVPRERCGWCLACKSSAGGNKKGCFLNLAAANAIKGSARHLSALRLIKNGESHLPSIVAYLANMEESLRGLLVGPLQDQQYRQQWHKKLKEASNCIMLKPLLLELESNIRGIAFSGNWLKLIDDWPVESSGISGGASRGGGNQKRGTGGRRGRKRSLAPESATTANDGNNWKEFMWWRGGKISKFVLQRAALLSFVIRKAARQGTSKRISGVSYLDSSDFPRRTRQLAWRASVGLSRNSSQLALQVRYLDAHIRWKEFIPPDQIPSDGKGSDADFSAFRNAVVCDKKTVENKMRYALKFSNQKHLPVRVTKNILEAEDNQNENGKLWFSENHLPLYLIRDFEEKAGAGSSTVPVMSSSSCFANFHQRRVKAFCGDVFSYLLHKGDVFSCASCKSDVRFRDAVKCSSCQGKCHKDCTSKPVANKEGSLPSDLICKLCLSKRAIKLANYQTNASYLLPQRKTNGQQVVTAPKIIFRVGSAYSSQPVATVEASKVETQPIVRVETQPETKSAPCSSAPNRKRKKSQEITYFGLMWKKGKSDQTESDFRINNVIFKSKDSTGSSIKPTCCLCQKPYRPDLMYIRCQQCTNWFHGDALQVEEAKIFELVGYRCCRCRRRKIPTCPYSDNYKKPEPELIREENAVTTLSQTTAPLSVSSKECFGLPDEDLLVSSYGRVDPIREQAVDADLQASMENFVTGSNQKLSVRRSQIKNAEYLEPAGLPENAYDPQNQSAGSEDVHFNDMSAFCASEANYMNGSELLEWDVSQGHAYGVPATDVTANCQWNDPSYGNLVNEEYEPQTYFSFTELLASEDTKLDNPFEMSTGMQEDGYCTGDVDHQGISFDEMSDMVEDGSSNMPFPANEPSFDGLVCQKCKLFQPPPDLKCEICGLQIHPHCSPWVESEQLAGNTKWRCGDCREWR